MDFDLLPNYSLSVRSCAQRCFDNFFDSKRTAFTYSGQSSRFPNGPCWLKRDPSIPLPVDNPNFSSGVFLVEPRFPIRPPN